MLTDECIPFNGYINKNGYGIIPDGKGNKYAHRVAYEKKFGKLPYNYIIHHKCKNKKCINADHLEPCTQSDHIRKFHSVPGYDKDKIKELRLRGYSYEKIGEEIGWSRETVRKYVNELGLDTYIEPEIKTIKSYYSIPATYWNSGICRCGKFIEKKSYTGRPKSWCSTACRQLYNYSEREDSYYEIEYITDEDQI